MSHQYPYKVPSHFHRIETKVSRSRFVASVAPVYSVDDARTFIASIRSEMPSASHHVYAFRVGYGTSVTEGMSDDGEPSGTAGPPVLSILRGSKIGDIAVVVTRYFGGTKLGTGGLVRAYSEATHIALNSLAIELKIEKQLLGLDVPYSLFEQVKSLVEKHNGILEDEEFGGDVMLIATFAKSDIVGFSHDLKELSAGKIVPVFLDE